MAPSPGVLLLEDKLSFVFGVVTLLLLQFLVLTQPQLVRLLLTTSADSTIPATSPIFVPPQVPHAYTIILLFLLSQRLPLYLKDNFGLFFFDFCYFMNLSTILQVITPHYSCPFLCAYS